MFVERRLRRLAALSWKSEHESSSVSGLILRALPGLSSAAPVRVPGAPEQPNSAGRSRALSATSVRKSRARARALSTPVCCEAGLGLAGRRLRALLGATAGRGGKTSGVGGGAPARAVRYSRARMRAPSASVAGLGLVGCLLRALPRGPAGCEGKGERGRCKTSGLTWRRGEAWGLGMCRGSPSKDRGLASCSVDSNTADTAPASAIMYSRGCSPRGASGQPAPSRGVRMERCITCRAGLKERMLVPAGGQLARRQPEGRWGGLVLGLDGCACTLSAELFRLGGLEN